MGAHEILAVKNINGIVNAIRDVRETTRNYFWRERIPRKQNVPNGELMGKFTGNVFIADIIGLDAKARYRTGPAVTLERHSAPKIKHGVILNEANMELLDRIEANLATATDRSFWEDYIENTLIDLVDGVKIREETLIMAMLTDSFSYSGNGIEISGVGFGMPSDLKVTVDTVWSDPAATPIADIKSVNQIAEDKYGVKFNRVTMSRTAFNNAIRTDEFRELAQLFSRNTLPVSAFPNSLAREFHEQAFASIAGMTLEFDDRSYASEGLDGAVTMNRFMPTSKVILSNSEWDNNARVWDLASAVLEETKPGRIPSLIGSFDGPDSGPVGYATAADPNGDPPGIILWAASKAWPRKRLEAANACLTVE